ncbi:MAG: hypothetical protein C5B54_01995 [Acidobacteria bacterium]|nr:MAG: hypothetical protein C5B54_01995 [Acidobacteriota bacterium]
MSPKKSDDPQEYIARKEYKKAIDLLREKLSKQPKNNSIRLSLADTLFADNQQAEAINEYRTLASQYTEEGFLVKGIAVYKKILKLRPDMRDVEELLEKLSDKRSDPPSGRKEVSAVEPTFEETASTEIESKLFRDLSQEELRQVIDKLILRHYEEDTIIVQEGDPGDSLFIVARGEVRVLTKDSKQKEVTLASLGEGEFFGEVSLLTGRPRTATIITNVDSDLLELKRLDFDVIIEQFPHVRQVLEDFHQQRAYKTVEAMIQSFRSQN